MKKSASNCTCVPLISYSVWQFRMLNLFWLGTACFTLLQDPAAATTGKSKHLAIDLLFK